MVASSPTQGLLTKLLLAVAVLTGVGVAAGVATAPGVTLDALVERSHLASFYPDALPVGVTMRTALALAAGGVVAAAGCAAALLMRRPRRMPGGGEIVEAPAGDDAELPPPVVRRADAHSDAPPRRPIRASSELGAPLPIAGEETARPITEPPSVPEAAVVTKIVHVPEPMVKAAMVEPVVPVPAIPVGPPPVAALPVDLDQPLATFDPGAIRADPLEPMRALPPLVRPAPVPAPKPDTGAPSEDRAAARLSDPKRADEEEHAGESISELLARLERGRLARRAQASVAPVPARAETLDTTLERLRQLAAR